MGEARASRRSHTAAVRTIEERLDIVESELALRRLVAEYCHGADKRDLARFLAVWTPDARWVLGDDVEMRGHDAIRAVVERQWLAYRSYHHLTSNLVVEIDGDRATGECDVAVTVQLRSGRWIRGGGTYRDEFERRDGTWLIARRDARLGHLLDEEPRDDEVEVTFDDL